MNVCLWNCCSVVNKLSHFKSFIHTSDFHIFAVTESWCSPYIYDNEITPLDYFIFCKNHDSRGGGVFLITHNSIPSHLIPSPSSKETIAVEVLLPDPVVLCLTYIPPGLPISSVSNTIQYLSETMNQHNTILLGDFNFPDINWKKLSSTTFRP